MQSKLRFFCFRPEIPFSSKSSPKIKIVSLAEIWYQHYFEYTEFSGDVHFFRFLPGMPKYKLGPKIQNFQFKLKPGAFTFNSNMKNSVVVFTFSVLDRKYPFWANFILKNKIVSLSWNLIPRLTWTYKIQWCYSLLLF